jgi:hypothetical protein
VGTIFPDDRRAAERRRRREQIRRRRIVAGACAAAVIVGCVVAIVFALGLGSSSSAAKTGAGSTGTTGPGSSSTAPVSCRAVHAGTGIQTIWYRDRSDGCVPASQLVRYQCPQGTAPIIRAGTAGSARRYLGGMYAVSAKRPTDAVEVGQSGTSTVYKTPAGVVYVSEDGHTKRWLSLPSAVPGDGKRKAFLLGDSVMLGAKPAIVGQLSHHWDPHMDAAVSRSTPQGLAVIKGGGAAGAPAIVLQLGTNDGGTPSLYAENVAAVFKALRAVPLVVWLNIGHARSYYTEDDRIISAEAAKYPNMTVADWADTVPKDGTWSDGLHLKPAGAAAMATLVNDYLDGWRSATWSPSAVACSSAVDSAVA